MNSLLNKISEYPIKLYDGYKDHGRLPTAEMVLRRREDLPNIKSQGGSITRQGNRRNLNTQQDFYKNRGGLTGTDRDANTASQNKMPEIDQDIGGLVNLDPSRKIFTKKARMMSNGYYFIEVSRTDETFYIAAIKKRNANENYLIELDWSKSKEILAQFGIKDEDGQDQDFNKIIGSLEILENRLVLLNPNVKQQKVIRKKRTKTRGSQSQPRLKIKKPNTSGSPYKAHVKQPLSPLGGIIINF